MERIIAVIEVAIAIGIVGGAMRIAVGRVVLYGAAHAGERIHVFPQVAPGGLLAILPGAVLDFVLTIVVGVVQAGRIAQTQGRHPVGRAILVDGRGDAGEQVFARAVLGILRVVIVAVSKRQIIIAEVVAVGFLRAVAIAADITGHGLQAHGTHDQWRVNGDAAIGARNGIVTSHQKSNRQATGRGRREQSKYGRGVEASDVTTGANAPKMLDTTLTTASIPCTSAICRARRRQFSYQFRQKYCRFRQQTLPKTAANSVKNGGKSAEKWRVFCRNDQVFLPVPTENLPELVCTATMNVYYAAWRKPMA